MSFSKKFSQGPLNKNREFERKFKDLRHGLLGIKNRHIRSEKKTLRTSLTKSKDFVKASPRISDEKPWISAEKPWISK